MSLGRIVGDVNCCDSTAAQEFRDFTCEVLTKIDIEGAERFIEQQNRRIRR